MTSVAMAVQVYSRYSCKDGNALMSESRLRPELRRDGSAWSKFQVLLDQPERFDIAKDDDAEYAVLGEENDEIDEDDAW